MMMLERAFSEGDLIKIDFEKGNMNFSKTKAAEQVS
jgi:hypothetical protein